MKTPKKLAEQKNKGIPVHDEAHLKKETSSHKESDVEKEVAAVSRDTSIQAIRKEDLGRVLTSGKSDRLLKNEDEDAFPGISESLLERSRREARELLEASEKGVLYPELKETRGTLTYLVGAGVLLIICLAVFGGYKALHILQKAEGSTGTAGSQQVSTIPAPKPIPVETITIVDSGPSVGSQKENIATAADATIFKAPDAFKAFSYDSTVGKKISLSGTCHDTYYALLIFDSKDDYRKNPGAAKSNRAFPCPSSKHFTIDMNMQDLNLQSGSYYVFIADQGSTGSWYNPR